MKEKWRKWEEAGFDGILNILTKVKFYFNPSTLRKNNQKYHNSIKLFKIKEIGISFSWLMYKDEVPAQGRY